MEPGPHRTTRPLKLFPDDEFFCSPFVASNPVDSTARRPRKGQTQDPGATDEHRVEERAKRPLRKAAEPSERVTSGFQKPSSARPATIR
jgi:hypothetical protein